MNFIVQAVYILGHLVVIKCHIHIVHPGDAYEVRHPLSIQAFCLEDDNYFRSFAQHYFTTQVIIDYELVFIVACPVCSTSVLRINPS